MVQNILLLLTATKNTDLFSFRIAFKALWLLKIKPHSSKAQFIFTKFYIYIFNFFFWDKM